MKIVNTDNIENLILIKKEIEDKLIAQEEIEESLDISDFIDKYMHIEYACYYDTNIVPFGILTYDNETYLFVSAANEKQMEIVTNKIKLLKNDITNLTEIPIEEFATNENEIYVISNNKYYK